MIQTNNIVTKDGQFTTKYEQYHKGYRVQGAMMNVIGDKGIVKYANGFIVKDLNIDNQNIISREDAIDYALSYFNADLYAWEDSLYEQALKTELNNPDATYYPEANLVITKKKDNNIPHSPQNYRLCYRIKVEAFVPVISKTIYIDAIDGSIFDVIDVNNNDHSYNNGKLWTWYNGYHTNLGTTKCNMCINYHLSDKSRRISTMKYNANNRREDYLIKDANNNWVETKRKTAASAHWAAARAWDYYLNRGRWGSDYQGKHVLIRTEYPISGALWEDNEYYDLILLRSDQNGHSVAMLDVIAHEYTHGMIMESSELGKNNDFDAIALNEGYADIFGMVIEGYTIGNYDWTFAENMGTYQRNFADPNTDFGQYYTNNGTNSGASAAYYLQPGYWSSVNPHANGGVLRKWFYLLSNGGSFNGNTVLPLGIETSSDIAYITFNWWLWSNVTYPQAANQKVMATIAHYGICSNEHKQVVRSLRAVGFDITMPNCFAVVIDGPTIIEQEELYENSITWSANINEITDLNGKFTWNIPDSWNVTTNGNELILNDVINTNSQKIAVTYSTDTGFISTDSIIVHFSDEIWTQTNNMPSQEVIKKFDNNIIENGIEIYPNPTISDVNILINGFTTKADIEIYALNGNLIKKLTTYSYSTIVDVKDFKPGIYLIRIKSGNKLFNEKLSIVR